MKIDWLGNIGYCFPEPGTKDKINCGVCGVQMDVRRNVFGPTSWAMAVGGMKRLHDAFTCSRVGEDWHKRIYELKMDVYFAQLRGRSKIDCDKIKTAAAKEIRKILKKHAIR